jgi:hypothetical protein
MASSFGRLRPACDLAPSQSAPRPRRDLDDGHAVTIADVTDTARLLAEDVKQRR